VIIHSVLQTFQRVSSQEPQGFVNDIIEPFSQGQHAVYADAGHVAGETRRSDHWAVRKSFYQRQSEDAML
jgi:hypothetical protein